MDKEDPDHPAFTHLLSTRGAADEYWYLGYHPTWTWKAQGGVNYDSAHPLEDSRRPWHALRGVDNYIYKIISKIGK
jgi:hypothetical protein